MCSKILYYLFGLIVGFIKMNTLEGELRIMLLYGGDSYEVANSHYNQLKAESCSQRELSLIDEQVECTCARDIYHVWL